MPLFYLAQESHDYPREPRALSREKKDALDSAVFRCGNAIYFLSSQSVVGLAVVFTRVVFRPQKTTFAALGA